VPAKKATAKKARKATVRKTTTKARSSTGPAKRGDLIVVDSPQVGSPPREGEVLQVIQGEMSVSYRVRWADGHETLLSPKSGSARIVRASARA
jgi:hypothetical protein